ncbi:AAA family ATPase [Nonomuraea sp. NPDC049637]|uniref:AAA family ATPase n=1 Tax=Nonomuraea sp. NPDC049637 TaxID=3154356 RepID=UPI0034356B32
MDHSIDRDDEPSLRFRLPPPDEVIKHVLLQTMDPPATAEATTLLNGVMGAWRRHQSQGSSKPSLTLIAGYAGSGKTEFSRFLSEVTGWALIDKDTLTRPLVERLLVALGGDPHDRHTELYLREVRPLEYRCLMDTAFDVLGSGTSVILSAPFIAELADRDWVVRLTNRCATRGIEVAALWVRCDAESMRRHFELRDDPRDAWKLQNWDAYVSTLNTDTSPSTAHITVDNRFGAAINLVNQAREALKDIQDWSRAKRPDPPSL